jgi:hypothetical protein
MAQPFDPLTLTASGEPIRIAGGLAAGPVSYSASANGVLTYRPERRASRARCSGSIETGHRWVKSETRITTATPCSLPTDAWPPFSARTRLASTRVGRSIWRAVCSAR